MKKKQLYIALGVALVAVLGVIGYLGMGGGEGELDIDAGPPVLEENPSLSGALKTGDRFFKVENDFENGSIANVSEEERKKFLLDYESKSPSNYLIFTTPKNFSNTTSRDLVENLIVDDGLSGYVLGTYRPAEKGWHLMPSGNYLGAQTMPESEIINACETYFVIKISDEHNLANGFDKPKWEDQQKSQIAFDESYFKFINTGAAACSTEDKNLLEGSWNMVTTRVSDSSSLLNEFVGYDKVYAIWDTTVINQIDYNAETKVATNANQKLYVDSENTGSVNNLDDYFNGLIKSASVHDANTGYDGGKQDLWVYVGSEAVIAPPVNTPPELYPYEQTVDLSSLIDQKRKEAIEDGSWNNIFFMGVDSLILPNDSVFVASDLDNDDLRLSKTSSNGFDLELRDSEIFTAATDLKYSDLNLDTNGSKLFTLDTEVSDGVDSLSGTSRITYEWDNKCVALDNAYMEHLRRSLEFMIYKSEPKDASRFSELAEDARSSIIDSLKDPKTIDLENGESMDLNQDEIDQLTEELDKMLAKISYDPKYIENPPYLPATCGGGVASCVDMALCGVMVESVSIEKLGLGMIIENLAFKESPRQETESMLMTPDSQNIDFEDIKMEQSVLIQTDNVTEIENLDSGKSNLDSSAQFDKGSLVSPVKDSGVESNV